MNTPKAIYQHRPLLIKYHKYCDQVTSGEEIKIMIGKEWVKRCPQNEDPTE